MVPAPSFARQYVNDRRLLVEHENSMGVRALRPEKANVPLRTAARENCRKQRTQQEITLKNIRADEALFSDYGTRYWLD